MHDVFVYGTLRRGGAAFGKMIGARLKRICWTGWGYALIDLDAFPAMVRAKGGRVRGEVYAVDAQTLAVLDRYEGVPGLYTRDQIPLEDGTQVWSYVWAGSTRGRQIIGGDWMAGRGRGPCPGHDCVEEAIPAVTPAGRGHVCGVCERVLDRDPG